ncbi:MAG: MMPL family transporter [Epsilonproteobacteria bacterium]|nr:MMPL family transporter [Campylobacterota bacterium]
MTIRQFTEQIIKFRWLIVIMIPVIILTLAIPLKNLAFEGSYRIWFGEDSKVLNDYDNFRDVFGNDDALIITFKDEEGIFRPQTLGMIDRITQQLWQTKYIARVDSITNYQHVHANPEDPDDILVYDFITDIENQKHTYFEERKEIAVNDELIVDGLISKDAKTTTIIARVMAGVGEKEDVSFELRGLVEEILQPEVDKYGYRFYLNGGAIISTEFVMIAEKEGATFIPIIILTITFLLYLVFRRASGALLPMSIAIMTFLAVLGIQVALGYKLNNFTANVPIFAVAIAIADAMHLYWVWMLYRKEGIANDESIIRSMEKNLLPAFLTSITTAIGFASLTVSEIIPVKTLGIATACVALLAFLLTVLFVPAVLSILNPKIKKTVQTKKVSTSNLALRYSDFVIAHDKTILLMVIALFGLFAFGLKDLKVDSNTIKYFTEDAPMRQSVAFVEKNLRGTMAYEVVADSQEEGGIKTPEFLNAVDQFKAQIQQCYPVEVTKVSSLADIIKRYNKIFNADQEAFEVIPESKELSAQFLLLYSLSLPQGMEINDKMDITEQLLRITVNTKIIDTSKDLEMIEWIEQWWADAGYSCRVDGQTAMFANMQSSVTETLIYSISIALVVVSLMMLIIFRDVKTTLIFLLPNILPIILVLGVMGWLGIHVDMGVAVSAAIILGVAVDDTIHFLVKFRDARSQNMDFRHAIAYVVKYAGGAIVFTTLILSFSFLIFLFSNFNPNYHFGIVTAAALSVALIADLVMLPSIFSLLEKKRGNKLRRGY